MKKITRRLYTKPVMLGMAFLVGAVLVVGLFVTTKSRAQGPFIPEGDDKFETTGNGETFHNFQNSPIKADFFGSGSQAYAGNVPLEGVPLGGADGNTDTVIHRNQCSVPCTTAIKMTKLNLKSINSITVTYADTHTEAWNVKVNLSTLKESTGSMSINSGGTFDSTLKVWPKFTFTRVSDNKTLTLDTGDSSLTAAMSQAAVSDSAVESDDAVAVPAPTIAPCRATATPVDNEFDSQTRFASSANLSAAATSSCAPVTLTSTNSPWQICNGVFCIPRPITEAELWASHNASPPGTKKIIVVQQQQGAVAE
jgi:hypothetical protein